MRIIIDEDEQLGAELLEKFQEAAEICLKNEEIIEPKAGVELSLSFVSNDEIQELNREYRDKDAVTDVLSFPQYESKHDFPKNSLVCLGDVVISSDKARSQAEEFGHSFERELLYLFVHSVFHLLGYDHMEEDEKKEMRQREEAVMKVLGVERT